MFEKFTKPARSVVEGAVVVATDSRATHVRPEHLFVALLGDDTCLAVRVLSGLGAPADRVLEELEGRRNRYLDGLGDEDAEALATIGIDLDEVLRRMGDDAGERRKRGRPRFSRETKKVLELSLREAIRLRNNHIGTEHLLLGLVRGGDSTVRDTLAAVDVTPEALRAAVADAVRKAG
jgi:ATP-dependent Clp protease ATP-binding subunit ClpA